MARNTKAPKPKLIYQCDKCSDQTVSATDISGIDHRDCESKGRYRLSKQKQSIKRRRENAEISAGEQEPIVLTKPEDRPPKPPADLEPEPKPKEETVIPTIHQPTPEPTGAAPAALSNTIQLTQHISLGEIATAVARAAQTQLKPLAAEQVWLAARTTGEKTAKQADAILKEFDKRFRI